MNRTLVKIVVVSLSLLANPLPLRAQSQFVNDLISSMVSAGFDFSEVDKLKMGKLLAEKGIINCQVTEWGKSVDAGKLDEKARYEFLEERVKEFETKVSFVSRRLSGLLGENDQSRQLVRSIARDNDLKTILDEVMPKMQSLVDRVKSDLKDELEITRIMSSEYRQSFASLCQKVKNIDDRVSVLERQGERRSLRPVLPNNQPSLPANNVDSNGVIYPDRIVGDKSLLCSSSTMVRKCYDYTPLEEINGQLIRRAYHGDLYADCSGYILVTHVKTSGGPINSYPSYSYQVQPASASTPTLAPALPSYRR